LVLLHYEKFRKADVVSDNGCEQPSDAANFTTAVVNHIKLEGEQRVVNVHVRGRKLADGENEERDVHDTEQGYERDSLPQGHDADME
jgi:hypothetical protein